MSQEETKKKKMGWERSTSVRGWEVNQEETKNKTDGVGSEQGGE